MEMTLEDIQTKYKGQIPTPLFDIARDLEIDIYETESFADFQSGSLSKEGGHFVIYVNAFHAPTRKRFTIAHELGHYLKHKNLLEGEIKEHIDTVKQPITDTIPSLHRDEGVVLSAEERAREVEANKIAAELLMPKDEFIEAWESTNDPEVVANMFKVSVGAVAIRAKVLLGVTMY